MKNKETLEEAAAEWTFETNGHKWSNNDDTAGDNYGSFIAGAKWQKEQDKKLYSEEEVKEILRSYADWSINGDFTYYEWFEQFKKK